MQSCGFKQLFVNAGKQENWRKDEDGAAIKIGFKKCMPEYLPTLRQNGSATDLISYIAFTT